MAEEKTNQPIHPTPVQIVMFLRYHFPELDTDAEMDACDTVDAVCSLYHYARINRVEELLGIVRHRRDNLRKGQQELNRFLGFDYEGPLTELLNTDAEVLVEQANTAREAREEADEAREARDTT